MEITKEYLKKTNKQQIKSLISLRDRDERNMFVLKQGQD